MANVWKKQKTVHTLSGKRVPARTPGAAKVTVHSRKWYGTLNGRHVPLCADRQAAERMLRKLEADAALAGVGLADPFAGHKKTPLADHLSDFAAHLRAKGSTSEHVAQTIARVMALFEGCVFRLSADVDAGRAAEWLHTLRQPKPVAVAVPPGVDAFTPAQAAALLGVSGAAVRAAVKRHGLSADGHGKARRYPRATVAALADRMGRGCGPETVNHYVRAVRSFFRWMVRAKWAGRTRSKRSRC